MNTTVSYTSSRPLFIILCLVVLVFALFPELAHASGGVSKVNNFMDDLAALLRGISVITVTVAIMWVGYEMLFTEWDIRKIGRILISALCIGCAAEIARYFVV